MDKKMIKQIPTQRTRAEFRADTFNETDRTVEVVFATERGVRTFDWNAYEDVEEVLVCEEGAGDLTRLNSGAPLLDNHNRYGKVAEVVVGVVESARFEGNLGIAKVRFGKSEYDTDLMEKVRDKIVTGVSVGYNVYEYQITRSEGKIPKYRATKWEPTEISFTPVQADVDSRARSEADTTHSVEIIEQENNTNLNTTDMPDAIKPAAPDTTTAAAPVTAAQVAAAAPVVENPSNLEEVRSAAVKAERNRAAAINGIVRTAGLPQSFAETLIVEGVDLETASTRTLAEWEKGNPANPVQNGQQVHTANESIRSAMTNALVLRINPNAATVIGEENVRAAQEFRGMSFIRFAEESLIRSGVKTTGMSQKDIAVMALGGKVRGLHHTSDFPLLLMDTVNRTLLSQYAIQERTFTAWTRRETFNDFRSVTRVRLTEILGNLEEVKEGAEYKYATMSESGETYNLAKYGKIIGITWEAIINDDLSAFTRIPAAFAVKAANLQSDIVYSMILSKGFALMSDGNALFSAAHGNFVGTAANQTAGGTALSEASLTLAYTSFREQKGPDGSYLNLKPKFLIVGPKLEFLAQKLTSVNFVATKQADTPVGSLTGLTLVVDARITGLTWFLAADPNMIDTVEYAFLAGYEDLFIDEREGFNIDGIEVKARLIFGAKAIDWRGLYRNNGAA